MADDPQQPATSDRQRFDQMLVHLTPQGATVPYTVCHDPAGDIWVASKGGLFKFHGATSRLLWNEKNQFPRRMAPYAQVVCHQNTIIHCQAEDKDGTSILQFRTLDGEQTHEQFIEGLVQSLVVSPSGRMYMTKQPKGFQEFSIYSASFDAPLGWEEFVSSEEFAFQALCIIDESRLLAACTTVPINMYSKQWLKWIDVDARKVSGTFTEAGKEPGQIFFPRAIQMTDDGDVVVMDKTGRFQRFGQDGKCKSTVAKIDAYLGNGFALRHGRAVVAMSGIMLDKDGRSLCDDWLEEIELKMDS